MTKNGIDVSEHQGAIDWSKVNTDFAILRAGYGKDISQKDKCFESNYSGCKGKGIPCGAYWYSYAVTAEDARKEAAVCLEVLKGKQFEYPVFFDIEEERQIKLGKAACSEIAKAFLEAVEKAGYFVGIYSSKSHLETYINDDIRKRYAVWVAHYGVSKTTYSGDYGIWQKSSAGTASGINGSVDLDECYTDYPTIIKDAGLNGFPKATTNVAADKSTKKVTLIIDDHTYSGLLTEE